MSEIKETKMVERESTVSYKCDACGKLENDYNTYDETWFNFNENHSGWGNDDIDSFVYYDVCSVKCFLKKLSTILPSLQRYPQAEVAHMPATFAAQLLALKGEDDD